ncbi:hypothetical protein [Nostoc sp.]|uniref:hypothetical protein n=1 Tax=Nostoc sp. TaxID=1180 RepID=UPI002FF52BFE
MTTATFSHVIDHGGDRYRMEINHQPSLSLEFNILFQEGDPPKVSYYYPCIFIKGTLSDRNIVDTIG